MVYYPVQSQAQPDAHGRYLGTVLPPPVAPHYQAHQAHAGSYQTYVMPQPYMLPQMHPPHSGGPEYAYHPYGGAQPASRTYSQPLPAQYGQYGQPQYSHTQYSQAQYSQAQYSQSQNQYSHGQSQSQSQSQYSHGQSHRQPQSQPQSQPLAPSQLHSHSQHPQHSQPPAPPPHRFLHPQLYSANGVTYYQAPVSQLPMVQMPMPMDQLVPRLPPITGHGYGQAPRPASNPKKISGGVAATLNYEIEDMAEFLAGAAYKIMVPPLLASYDGPKPLRKFVAFIHQLLTATRLPKETVLLSLVYLSQRYRGAHLPDAASDRNVVYRMLVVSLLLANKFNDDNTFTNKSWNEATGISVPVLTGLEAHWLCQVKWSLHLRADGLAEWHKWERMWQTFLHKMSQPQLPSPPLSASSSSLSPVPLEPSPISAHSHSPITPVSPDSRFFVSTLSSRSPPPPPPRAPLPPITSRGLYNDVLGHSRPRATEPSTSYMAMDGWVGGGPGPGPGPGPSVAAC